MNGPRIGRGANRADARFAQLLDLSSPAIAADASMGSMLLVANALSAAGHSTGPAAPDPAFRAALRQRLVAVATVQAVEPITPIGRERTAVGYRVQRRVAALAGAVAIVTSVAGVGVAASRSLPGDPFYGIKRGTEGVQLWAASGNLAKGRRHLEFARTRLAEAQALPPNSSHLASTFQAMNVQTADGTHDLIAAYTASKSLVPLADLETFTQQQVAGLISLAPTLPAGLRSQDQQAITLLTGVVNTVNSVSHHACVLCTVTGGGSPLPGGGGVIPPSLLPSVLPSITTGILPTSPANPTHHASTAPTLPTPPVSPSTGATSRSHPTLPTSVPTILPTKIPTLIPTAIPTLIQLPPSLLPTLPPLGTNPHKSPKPSLPPLPISSLLPTL
jgi:Domain of unknown function (DUF5667)